MLFTQPILFVQFGGVLVKTSIFHENWWLAASTAARFQETVVTRGKEVIGRLPFVEIMRGPFRILRMPAFTHTLGPVVDAGEGKPQTRLMRRLSIVRSLVDQLPFHSHFQQALDPSLDDGLALVDGLAFQDRQFFVSSQYNFTIDCRQDLDEMWAALYLKTRQHVRRAEKAYTVRTVEDPHFFVQFYLKNIDTQGRVNSVDFTNFGAVFSECNARQCGCILGAFDHIDAPIAMTFLIWGHGIMYYLMSTRSVGTRDEGAISLLIWSAMRRAHELALILDLDGIYSSGAARFLSNFGGNIKQRLIISRSRKAFGALRLLNRYRSQEESHFFT
jgi:hypothetical protein